MRSTRVLAAVAVAAALAASALLLPGAALAAQPGPAGPAALLTSAGVPVGSLWVVGSGATPACRTVSAPPSAPSGEAAILVGAPGGLDQWCGFFARLGPAGVVTLPGGIPGERLSPAQYARETGGTVIVAYTPHGRTVVYLPA